MKYDFVHIVGPDPGNGPWGFIPTFLNKDDPRSAREQFNVNYVGGWRPFQGFRFGPSTRTLKYPGDPAHKPVDTMQFRDETIILYPHAWVLVLQKDGTWEVCRMD